MADMLEDGAGWLASQLAGSAGRTCGYRRGANTATVTATIGRSQFDAMNQSGITETWESRDYLIRTEELPYGEPVRGDIIIEDVGGVSTFYQVTAPRGMPVFHPGDAFQKLIRVHTKQLDRDQAVLIDEFGDEIVVPLIVE